MTNVDDVGVLLLGLEPSSRCLQPRDPASYGDDVAKAAKEAVLVRYRLLPYLYTLFHWAHTRGSTVARPVLHE